MTKEINDKIIKMENDIHYIKEALSKMPTKEGMKLANKELIEEVLAEANKRYASKTTEKIVYGLVWIILAGVLVAGLNYLV